MEYGIWMDGWTDITIPKVRFDDVVFGCCLTLLYFASGIIRVLIWIGFSGLKLPFLGVHVLRTRGIF